MTGWLFLAWLAITPANEWGFYGHRMINRSAVYTLPSNLLGWYKPQIDFIADHAVDADKRRYATRHEAVRHYFDLDHWGDTTFAHIPRRWTDALALTLEIFSPDAAGDTLYLMRAIPVGAWLDSIAHIERRKAIVSGVYLSVYYEQYPEIAGDSLLTWFGLLAQDRSKWQVRDALTRHGILPYHLAAMQRRLTDAFRSGDSELILRLSADLGHYIGDACVPLHTTANYNGQLSNQIGIHAFWESRIPELFAEKEFDLLVGTADYISDPESFYWQLVFESHREVDRVLSVERALRSSFPEDKQLCFEERLGQTRLMPCAPFAKAFDAGMEGMVEARFRRAIKAVGDAWYTAWVDAGQPDPQARSFLAKRSVLDDELDASVRQGHVLGREHSD